MQTNTTAHLLTRVAQGWIALVLAVAPFPFGSVQDGWVFALQAGACLLMALWVIIQVFEGETSWVRTRLTWPAAALFAYLLLTFAPLGPRIIEAISQETFSIQHFASETLAALGTNLSVRHTISLAPFDTEGELLKMAAYAVFFFVGLDILRYRQGFIPVLWTLTGTGTLVALLGILQSVFGNGRIYWVFESGSGSPFGPFVNHNHFAGYIELTLGLSLGLLLCEVHRFRRDIEIPGSRGYFAWIWHPRGSRVWLLVFATFVMLAALTASLSRGGMLSFLLAGALVGIRILLSGRKSADMPGAAKRRNWSATAGWLLLGAFILLGLLSLSPRVRERWAALRHPDAKYRIAVWQEASRGIADFSLVGTGLGTFRSIFPRYKSSHFHSETAHAENEYLEWQLETGIAGSLLLLAAGLALARQIVFRLGSRKSLTARSLGYGAVFGMISLSIHNAMDFNMHIPSNALTVTVLACLCLLVINTRKGNGGDRFMLEVRHNSVGSARGIAMLIGAIILCGLLGWRSWSRFNSRRLEDAWSRQRQYLPQGDPDEARLALLDESLRSHPGNARAHFLKASAYTGAAAQKTFLQLIQRNRLLESAERETALALSARPAEASYWALLARIHTAGRRLETAERFYQHALRLGRSDGTIHRDYGLLRLEIGDIEGGAARLLVARTYTPQIGLQELLEVLAARTSDRRVWQSVVRYQSEDLKGYAAFLQRRGFPELAEQFWKQAADLGKAHTTNPAP